jgi:voltage-gated potassium channel
VTATPRIGSRHNSAIELLGALVLIIVFLPLLEQTRYGKLIEMLLWSLVFTAAVLLIGDQPSRKWTAGALMVGALVTKFAEHFLAPTFPQWVFPPLMICFLAFVIMHLVRSTLHLQQVDANVICAAIAAYLIIGLLWAMAYLMVGQLSPDAFAYSASGNTGNTMDRFNAFYFSFVTLSTVGYGDITPISRLTRMLAVTEAMTGMLYVTVLIARLVSLYSANIPQPPDQE